MVLGVGGRELFGETAVEDGECSLVYAVAVGIDGEEGSAHGALPAANGDGSFDPQREGEGGAVDDHDGSASSVEGVAVDLHGVGEGEGAGIVVRRGCITASEGDAQGDGIGGNGVLPLPSKLTWAMPPNGSLREEVKIAVSRVKGPNVVLGGL